MRCSSSKESHARRSPAWWSTKGRTVGPRSVHAPGARERSHTESSESTPMKRLQSARTTDHSFPTSGNSSAFRGPSWAFIGTTQSELCPARALPEHLENCVEASPNNLTDDG